MINQTDYTFLTLARFTDCRICLIFGLFASPTTSKIRGSFKYINEPSFETEPLAFLALGHVCEILMANCVDNESDKEFRLVFVGWFAVVYLKCRSVKPFFFWDFVYSGVLLALSENENIHILKILKTMFRC